MGIREKRRHRKEQNGMKRITVISVLIIFIAGTFGASFAFAAKTDDSTKKGKSRAESVLKKQEMILTRTERIVWIKRNPS